ncbi:hypothetical protein [Mycobacteroides abscessus]|uniref:hypothetical protein n=1 Tax=Mycobacteroides abscessus TaxID=36809 RepID=UPI0018782A7F|nr:hypothetical protein [Mycobacteroides abscessus]MDM2086016.1 hypothetical protein [Mycobacteroides abscessus]
MTIAKAQQEIAVRKNELTAMTTHSMRSLGFSALKALHRDSCQRADIWYGQLKASDSCRRTVGDAIQSMSRQPGYAGIISDLEKQCSQLKIESNLAREQLDIFNQRTGWIRDYIGDNCGIEGWQWRFELMKRSELRSKKH